MSSVSARLAPREPIWKFYYLGGVAAGIISSCGAHGHETDGAPGQRLATIRTGRHLRWNDYTIWYVGLVESHLNFVGGTAYSREGASSPREAVHVGRDALAAEIARNVNLLGCFVRWPVSTQHDIEVGPLVPQLPSVEKIPIAANFFITISYCQ